MPQKAIQLRMSFEGELAKRLEAIKEYLQLESYTDTIRSLITEKYEKIKG